MVLTDIAVIMAGWSLAMNGAHAQPSSHKAVQIKPAPISATEFEINMLLVRGFSDAEIATLGIGSDNPSPYMLVNLKGCWVKVYLEVDAGTVDGLRTFIVSKGKQHTVNRGNIAKKHPSCTT